MAQYVDPYAASNAFARTVQMGQQQNAFNAQQRQQEVENARADEVMQMRRTQFDQEQAQQAADAKRQSLTRVGAIASKALSITDPAQRKGFLQTAIPAYAQDFTAIGSDTSKLSEMLAMPDAALEQSLQQVAQFAPAGEAYTLGKNEKRMIGGREIASNMVPEGQDANGFTLAPEAIRFDASGKEIARGAPKSTTLTKPEGFDIAAKLRGEYNKQAQEFTGVADAFQRIKDSAADPSAAGDLSLIFNYMKVLDPGSTVREGEFATAQNAGGAWDRVGAMYNRILKGERLAEAQRADFVGRAEKLYKGQEDRFNTRVKGRYESLARRYGLDPAEVLSDPSAMPANIQPASAAPSRGAPGTPSAPTATGPNGQKLILQNGQWVPFRG